MALGGFLRRPIPGLRGPFSNYDQEEYGYVDQSPEQVETIATVAPPPGSADEEPFETRSTYPTEAGTRLPGAGIETETDKPRLLTRPDLQAEPSSAQFGQGFERTRDYYQALNEPLPEPEKRGGFSRFLGGLTSIIGPTRGTSIPERLTYKGEPPSLLYAKRREKLAGLKTQADMEQEAYERQTGENDEMYKRQQAQAKIDHDLELEKSIDQNELIRGGYRLAQPGDDPNRIAGRATGRDGKEYVLPVEYKITSGTYGVAATNPLDASSKVIVQPPVQPTKPDRRVVGRQLVETSPEGKVRILHTSPESGGRDYTHSDQRFAAETAAEVESRKAKALQTLNEWKAGIDQEFEEELADVSDDWFNREEKIASVQARKEKALQPYINMYNDAIKSADAYGEARTRHLGTSAGSTGGVGGAGGVRIPPPSTSPSPSFQVQPPNLPPPTIGAPVQGVQDQTSQPATANTFTAEEVRAQAAQYGTSPEQLKQEIEAAGGTVTGWIEAPVAPTMQVTPPAPLVPPPPTQEPEPPPGIRLGRRGQQIADTLGNYFGSFKDDKKRAAAMRSNARR